MTPKSLQGDGTKLVPERAFVAARHTVSSVTFLFLMASIFLTLSEEDGAALPLRNAGALAFATTVFAKSAVESFTACFSYSFSNQAKRANGFKSSNVLSLFSFTKANM